MLRKTVKVDEPIYIQIGDVYVAILRCGDRAIDLAVEAPRDLPISFGVCNGQIRKTPSQS